MLHPHTEIRQVDDTIGVGVFATRDLPRGTVVWVRDPWDREIDPAQVPFLPADLHAFIERYAYEEEGRLILCWDHARFVNHSCEATNLGLDLGFEIVVRDVAAGEQLTDDYALLGTREPMRCACGSPRCRGFVRPEDVITERPRWMASYVPALALAPHVDQPMWGRAHALVTAAIERWTRQDVALTARAG